MKKLVKAVIALGILAGAVAFAPNVKVQLVEPSAAACDSSTGQGCD